MDIFLQQHVKKNLKNRKIVSRDIIFSPEYRKYFVNLQRHIRTDQAQRCEQIILNRISSILIELKEEATVKTEKVWFEKKKSSYLSSMTSLADFKSL